jgi:transcriptional regulator with XRE-family HTH domain
MALEEGNLAQNVRRLAGMHLVSLDRLARHIGISRPTMQAIVAHDPAQRSLPRTETVIRLAEAFGVSLDALYSEPVECLREAVERFEVAPIRQAVDVPSPSLKQLKGVAQGLGAELRVGKTRRLTGPPRSQKRRK